MKVGDLVACQHTRPAFEGVWCEGLIVGFSTKGEGGKDYVHVLIDGKVEVFMRFKIEVINEGR